MDDRLAVLLPVAAVWLAAGLVAEGLPGSTAPARCAGVPDGCPPWC
ncbi:hypothetical protein V2I01_14010 [Micromonospora sp. BRA006-A]|nr:hypothetical protein [Micromonospora sp. BRA006-A]